MFPQRQSTPEETQKETFFSSPSRTDSLKKKKKNWFPEQRGGSAFGGVMVSPYLNFLAHIPAGVQKVSFSLDTA